MSLSSLLRPRSRCLRHGTPLLLFPPVPSRISATCFYCPWLATHDKPLKQCPTVYPYIYIYKSTAYSAENASTNVFRVKRSGLFFIRFSRLLFKRVCSLVMLAYMSGGHLKRRNVLRVMRRLGERKKKKKKSRIANEKEKVSV